MHGFFKRFILKDDKKAERKKILKQVDEVDVCVIDVETIRCVVCLNVYQGTPQILTCGHSFCHTCVEEVGNAEFINDPRDVNRNSFHCPICRKRVQNSKIVHNYALKTILDSVNEISKDEVKSRKAYDNTIHASNEQLRLKCIDMERSVDCLRKEINHMRQKEKYNYVAISFFVIVYIILSTLYGN
ncbi:unnamed protein product [Caenorhabditis angaria]|uniref:RING-type domain-containing protein n=1 Tax=Caenorhabditis angaria TaxID=860376 RepID=A0A9P1J5F6_9PELO|nr:unnamed protein product [Caenorhabditis angaria]